MDKASMGEYKSRIVHRLTETLFSLDMNVEMENFVFLANWRIKEIKDRQLQLNVTWLKSCLRSYSKSQNEEKKFWIV